MKSDGAREKEKKKKYSLLFQDYPEDNSESLLIGARKETKTPNLLAKNSNSHKNSIKYELNLEKKLITFSDGLVVFIFSKKTFFAMKKQKFFIY